MSSPKSKGGRPPVLRMPGPIADATPEALAQAIMRGPPKETWRFEQPGGEGYGSPTPPTRRAPAKAGC